MHWNTCCCWQSAGACRTNYNNKVCVQARACTCTCTYVHVHVHSAACKHTTYVKKHQKKTLIKHTCASSETPVPLMLTACVASSSSSSSYHAHGESAAALSYKRMEGFPLMSSLMVPSMMVYIFNVKHRKNNGWTD